MRREAEFRGAVQMPGVLQLLRVDECWCQAGFAGSDCSTPDAAACGSCSNCVADLADGTCRCLNGYGGASCACQDAVDCSGHGTCTDTGCACRPIGISKACFKTTGHSSARFVHPRDVKETRGRAFVGLVGGWRRRWRQDGRAGDEVLSLARGS